MSTVRAKALVEAIAGRTLTNQQAIDLATNYLGVGSIGISDNEELAQAFIEDLRRTCKARVRAGEIQLAASTIADDLDEV